ncbi:hypothetical protein WQ54_07900 [Bacillus sp. SA1-12]|uniref:hypothetical protein n=1 Tax=Bacillus sp. SA1-12 TaxID=1455638 RepID=UPI000625D8A3|nr:hypothetical protein [Bacillus sp. SA1-12]KKI92789.1 hypothetical protein WQ54_07900 [Bacillus sp. SA1-12]
MRKIIKFSILLIPIFLITIMIINITKTERVTSFIENEDNHLYINFVDKELNQIFYQYDLNKKINKILLKEKISEYPTATYSKSKNEVFFTYKSKNKTAQAFKKNLNNNQTTQLTNEFSHVDFLELDEEEQLLFMRVLMYEGDRNFQLSILDLKDQEAYKWDNTDEDISVHLMDYNPNNKQILLVTNSVKKEYEKITQANKKGISPDPPVYTLSIYNTDGQKVKDITTINSFLTGASLSSDGKDVLISYFNNQEELTSNIATIDIATQKVTLLLKDSKIGMKEPEYNKNKSGFYYLADQNKGIMLSDENPNKVTLNFYDIVTKKNFEVWSQENGEIVNFFVEK